MLVVFLVIGYLMLVASGYFPVSLGGNLFNIDIYLLSTHGPCTRTKCGYVVLSLVGAVLSTHYFLQWIEVNPPTKNYDISWLSY